MRFMVVRHNPALKHPLRLRLVWAALLLLPTSAEAKANVHADGSRCQRSLRAAGPVNSLVARLKASPIGTNFARMLGILRGIPNRGKFHRVSTVDFTNDPLQAVQRVLPEGFSAGTESQLGNVRYRLITLGPRTKWMRVLEILGRGTDRTNAAYKSRYGGLYERAAKQGGVSVLDVFDTMGSADLAHHGTRLSPGKEGIRGANAILVYDWATKNGIKRIEAFECTFKNPKNKPASILALIEISPAAQPASW